MSTESLVPGSVIVRFDEDFAESLADAPATKASAVFDGRLEGLGVLSVERLYPDAGKWEPRHRKAGLHRWYRVTFDPAARTSTKAAADFSSVPGVVFAEPERRAKSTAYFNDPYAPQQWALFNDGTRTPNSVAGCDINVEPVWDLYTAGSPDVVVAVIDEGIQFDHPDLAPNCIPGGPEGSKCFLYDREGYVIYPGDHGTHVAGTIAAVNNNEIGVCGIAGGYDGQGSKVMSCQILMENPRDPDNPYQGNSYNAMVWAADHGAVISQNSWGYVYESEDDAKKGGVGAIGAAIDYFIKNAGCDENGNQRADSPMKGGIVIFAAGNESWSMAWPAAYEPVIAVGATSAKFTRAYYSNYGSWVDICAPGGDAKLNSLIRSTVSGSSYANYQGTSMACPHVSGVAALLVSYYGGPGFTNEMLKERLIGGAAGGKLPSSTPIGPLLDALGSFTYGGTTPPDLPSEIGAEVSSNSIALSWKVTPDSDDIKAYGYMVVASKTKSEIENIDITKIPESVITTVVEVGRTPIGETISATLSELEFETDYYVSLLAYDYAGNYSAPAEVKTVQTAKNDPPAVSTDYTGDFVIEPFEKLTVDYTVADPNGHQFTVEIDPGSDALTWKLADGVYQITIAGNGAPHGSYTAHILATDSYGEATDYPIAYEIKENHAPVAVADMDNLQFAKTGARSVIDMSKYVSDEDGEQLSFSASLSDKTVANISQDGNNLVVTSRGFGLSDVTVTATDACKAKCTLSFKILVRDSDNSGPVDLYPNPVVDVLNVRPAAEGQLQITVYNKSGATILEILDEASPFTPVAVDLSGKPGGLYYVKVQGAGIDGTYTIAKR